jgi:hypothetical protein
MEAIALLDWMIGFENRAIAAFESMGRDPKAAAEHIRSRVAKYWAPTTGPREAAAQDQVKGLSVDLQQHVVALAGELDALEAHSPQAYASLIRSLGPQRSQALDKKS